MIDDFKNMMSQTVTHSVLSSRDAYGARTFSTGTEYAARVVYKNTRVRSSAGADIMARGMVWLLGNPTVSTEDQLELPDGTVPPILSVEQFPDENGLHHTKIYFG